MLLNSGKQAKADKLAKKLARKKEIQLLMKKFGGEDMKIDMDELRELLTDLDAKKSPPLPKDLLWCMSEGDKDKSGHIGKSELENVLDMYKKYKEDAPDMVKLIKKHDINKDMQLDDAEMGSLLKEATGTLDVTPEDINTVNLYLKENLTLTKERDLDPTALAKAISRWDNEKNLSEGMFSGLLAGPQLPDIGKSWTDFSSFVSASCSCSEEKGKTNKAGVQV